MKVLAKYPSKSNPGKYYDVCKGNDDVTYCTCWGWKKNRTCEHLKNFTKKESQGITLNTLIAQEVKRLTS